MFEGDARIRNATVIKNRVGTAAPGCPGERSSPGLLIHLEPPSAYKTAELRSADSRGRLSPRVSPSPLQCHPEAAEFSA